MSTGLDRAAVNRIAASIVAMEHLGMATAAFVDRLHATAYPGLTREQFERRLGIERPKAAFR